MRPTRATGYLEAIYAYTHTQQQKLEVTLSHLDAWALQHSTPALQVLRSTKTALGSKEDADSTDSTPSSLYRGPFPAAFSENAAYRSLDRNLGSADTVPRLIHEVCKEQAANLGTRCLLEAISGSD